ncbi:sulfate transporter CysZ [Pasteurella skyensis]|uniref:Sulfate transporter CysZ n=1 Tax=Phocoenobacter skyensis TaxID=97481 RepID=A0AAJ6P169_9PAST|nr:sulfate transporter CysZ [Pasteurella skyensis]MDP8163151.1 sulfate transporter CysZ [Pasteurella skyensis]MDP8173374.1 sulfate transporter CysZ [Pasteurella skyensis]MDP8179534.1 sulfate transporter CysZ [Pasteurella skyensis]MDP8182494.1 sulfate transporter CysZ [Pasteurella skyensis]MDP8189792.1 sulfate transporter CysZ [Pasteurella skyensis]
MTLLLSPPQNQFERGIYYFTFGWRLIFQHKLFVFILFPLLINIGLIVGLLWLFIINIDDWLNSLVSFMPSWLDWITVVLVPLAILSLIIVFYFTFTTLANFIAAPFNGLLAEKVELQLTGELVLNTSLTDMLKDIPRMLKREWQKMMYALPRVLFLFILGFTPLLGQTVIPLLFFVFSCWMLAIQYCDYPFDNHKISFIRMQKALSQSKIMNFTFGTLVSIATLIPVINLVIMPVAVCGATAMWVKEYRSFFLNSHLGEFDDRKTMKKNVKYNG